MDRKAWLGVKGAWGHAAQGLSVSTLCGPSHVLLEKLLSGCFSVFRGVLTAVFTVKLGSVFS